MGKKPKHFRCLAVFLMLLVRRNIRYNLRSYAIVNCRHIIRIVYDLRVCIPKF